LRENNSSARYSLPSISSGLPSRKILERDKAELQDKRDSIFTKSDMVTINGTLKARTQDSPQQLLRQASSDSSSRPSVHPLYELPQPIILVFTGRCSMSHEKVKMLSP